MSETHKSDKLLIAGASLPITEGIMAAMHGGTIGGFLALGASGLVYVFADELERRGMGITLPRPARRERQPGEHSITYKLFNGRSYREAQAAQEDDEDEQDGCWIPPQFDLEEALDVIESFNNQHSIYFGHSEEGAVAIPLNKMYHVMDVTSSGNGKSNRLRLAMMQMVNHCQCYYINPIASAVKAVKDERKIEVWQPIFDRLANKRPMKEGAEIEDLLRRLVKEIKRRNALEEQRDFSWMNKPIFVFVDELAEVFNLCPKAIECLDKIGRMGRNYCVFCWVAGQSAQVEEIGQNTAAQANYKTRIYGGGDQTSANRLMKGGVTDEMERALLASGEGLDLMLAPGISRPSFVRAPLVTNEGMFEYLELGEFRIEDWMRSSKKPVLIPDDEEDQQDTFTPSTVLPGSQNMPKNEAESQGEKGKGKRVKGSHDDAILMAMDELEEEERPLTMNAIAKRAGLTRHQYDDIEDVAAYYGYTLVRGVGRPAKEA